MLLTHLGMGTRRARRKEAAAELAASALGGDGHGGDALMRKQPTWSSEDCRQVLHVGLAQVYSVN